MISNLCLICSKNEIRIEKETGYIKLLYSIHGDDVILPTNNINYLDRIFQQYIDTLTPREEKVLKLRYGLVDDEFRTLEEVGKECGLTKERIRQIIQKALRKLKHPSRLGIKYSCQIFDYTICSYKKDIDYFQYEKKFKEILEHEKIMCFQPPEFKSLFLDKIINHFSKKSARIDKDVFNNSIEYMYFSVRTYNCLKRAGINTIVDILMLDIDKLRSIRNLGERSLNEIIYMLQSYFSITPEMLPICIDDLIKMENNSIKDDEEKNMKASHYYLNSLSISTLFDANFSPTLINLLLMNGYSTITEVLKESKKLINLLEQQGYIDCAKELKGKFDKYNDFSLITHLDIDFLNFLTINKIKNLKDLKSKSSMIENIDLKSKINLMIASLEKMDITQIQAYNFVLSEESDSLIIDEQLLDLEDEA